jgi:intracellular proteinase inhibitor BsuPI
MRARLIFVLLVAAGFAFSCGRRSHTAEPMGGNAPSGPPVVSSLNVKVNGEVAFSFHITNNATKSLELTFPSGQTYEITVLDSLGREVWRWSEGRLFTQALQNRVLEANETVTYQGRWKPSNSGRFTAVAALRSANHPLEQRLEFDLP